MLIDTRKSPYAKVAFLPTGSVEWSGGLWKERFDVCADVTVPHIRGLFEQNSARFHVVENFRVAAGLHAGRHEGTPFGDGDFYKWMEAAMYTARAHGDAALTADLARYVGLIAAAQQPDGYLSTKQIIADKADGGHSRLGNINDFEVYNFGHLFTAACTYKRLFGRDDFLAVAEKAAGYLFNMYEAALHGAGAQTAVCPSHYMGIIELYRTTGDARYLRLAEMAMQVRDMVKDGTDDNQDSLPLREHRRIVGHGVRSTYLYAGVADLYAETGEAALRTVLDSVWKNCVEKKLYITGGCGALYTGVSPYGVFNYVNGAHVFSVHQAFGYEYQLPNITAYNETCATLGNVMWNLRMFAIDPRAVYFDIIERSMLNLALAATSLQGSRYFYENMLRRVRTLDYELMWPRERKEELDCFCCPPNAARFVAQSGEYAYAVSPDAVWTGMYGACRAAVDLACGTQCVLEQQTDYPWDGTIRFRCREVRQNTPFTLRLRIPQWAASGSITVNGRRLCALTPAQAGSYYAVPVADPQRDEVVLTLDMPVRLTVAHTKLEEDINQVAVERGPLVYCVETPDAPVEGLDDLLLPADASFRVTDYRVAGYPVKALETEMMTLDWNAQKDRGALYQTLGARTAHAVPVRLIPYYAWDNRGFGEMDIWLPVWWGRTGAASAQE